MNFQQIRDFVNPQIAQATGLQPVDDLQMPVPVAHIVQDLVIDGQLSETSENPVQNKVITHAINEILEQFEGGIEEAVDNWLDDNPQATTTVQDGAITYAKLDNNLKAKADEVTELKNALQESVSEETGQELLDEEEKNTYLLTVALDNVDKLIASLPQDETLVSLIGELQTECEWLDMIYHELQVKQEASV